jgi:predicted O-methyltransferase YrrM
MSSVWFTPTVPARVKPIPWLHPLAIEYLETLLRPDMEILEHGAGGSTLWFAERVKHVTAVEDNFRWYDVLSKRIPANVTLLMGKGVVYLAPVDLLFIDGEPVETRGAWIDAAARLVKPGGYLILDNANRQEYLLEREKMRNTFTLLKHINGNSGGTLHLVTEFYQL